MSQMGRSHALPRHGIAVCFTPVSGIDSRNQALPSRARSGSQRLPRPSGLVLLPSQPALRVRAIPRADMNYVSRCRLSKQELSGALVGPAALLLAVLGQILSHL